MTRVREETVRSDTRKGTLRGLAVTGGVITSAPTGAGADHRHRPAHLVASPAAMNDAFVSLSAMKASFIAFGGATW